MVRLKRSVFRWLWGIPLLALMVWWINTAEKNRLQAELAGRANAVLKQAGHGWAKVTFNGREGLLSGTARSEQDKDAAIKIAQQIPGVRNLQSRTEVLPTVKPYTWSAIKKNGSIKLRGHVPSDQDRKTIVSRVQATLPNSTVSDNMKLAAGEPPQDVWLGGISFGLKQLSKLKGGTLRLEDKALALKGMAQSPDAYAQIKLALSRQLPQGITLKSDGVRAPAVSPFKFSASHSGGNLVLSGYVPDEAARSELKALAKSRFAEASVIDDLKIAAGAPENFLAAVKASMPEIKPLQNGSVVLTDKQIALSGKAVHKPAAKAAEKALAKVLPKGFKFSGHCDWTVVDPYVWNAALEGGSVTITGYVPDLDIKLLIRSAVELAVPEAKIIDNTKVGTGKMNAEKWASAVTQTIGKLGKLSAFKVTIENANISVEGTAADAEATAALTDALKSDAPDGFVWQSINLKS